MSQGRTRVLGKGLGIVYVVFNGEHIVTGACSGGERRCRAKVGDMIADI